MTRMFNIIVCNCLYKMTSKTALREGLLPISFGGGLLFGRRFG